MIRAYDHFLFEKIFTNHRNAFVGRILSWISRSADGPAYIVLAALLLLLRAPHSTEFLFLLLFGFALERPIYLVMKKWCKRDRPFRHFKWVEKRIDPPDYYSFPSGHATGAFLTATLVSSLFPTLSAASFVWAGLVAFSRICKGVHFPADVIMGALIGCICGFCSIKCYLSLVIGQ